MSDAGDSYDELMRYCNTAMLVVTASDGRERAGCVVGFHSQCGIDPLQHGVWLSKANHTYRVALHATELAVHFLTPSDEDVARLFGESSGDEIDKFEHVAWHAGESQAPLLDALPNRFIGRRAALFEAGGDHACFLLTVQDAHCAEDLRPLRFDALGGLSPGHAAEDRPAPAVTRTDPA
ncbi:flavin reductase family protein [Granulicoccus sp. GXG6511]|uniref:flavin reductase family protein n=1 Tax=Granulicoccus sp. GXG6511 TaxID=3381351 RepID=UPI003D7DE2BE